MTITFEKLHRPKDGCSATVLVDGTATWSMECARIGHDLTLKPLKGMKEQADGHERDVPDLKERVLLALREDLTRRDLRKLMDGNAVCVRDGKLDTIKLHNRDSLAETRTYLKKKYPKSVLLNDMDFDEALETYQKHLK